MQRYNTLNRWQRLWVMASAIYVIPLLFVVISIFPQQRDVLYHTSIYKKMSNESLSKIVGSGKRKIIFKDEIGLTLKTPNDHVLPFNKGVNEEEARKVAEEYYAVLSNIVFKKRMAFIVYAFLWWIIPFLFLYASGWSIGWVYKRLKSR